MQNSNVIKNQLIDGNYVSTIDAAKHYKLEIITNVSLNQTKDINEYSIKDMIQFLVNNSNITSSLIEIKGVKRVSSNINYIIN